MKEMRVLVACEFSGIGREAFRSKGHDAWSCDIIPSEGCPTHHIQGDVLEVLEDDWDLIIAHPPCTYLSNAGACRLYPTKGNIDEEQKRQIRRDEHGRPFSGPSCEHGIPYGTMWPCKICMQPKPTAPPEQGDPSLAVSCVGPPPKKPEQREEKKCPECGIIVGVPTRTCNCGFDFVNLSKEKKEKKEKT
ncbi:hypothetical protein LCGC14_3088330, partial [marine sediment metagenome]